MVAVTRLAIAVAWALGACAAPAPRAVAADLDHRILSWDSPRRFEEDLNRAAAQGYRLSALVDGASSIVGVVSRDRVRSGDAAVRYEYRVLDRDFDAALPPLAAQGFNWRSAAARSSYLRPVVVLERDPRAPGARDVRATLAREPSGLAAALAEPFAAGYEIRGRVATGDAKATWLFLERAGSVATPREARVVWGGGLEAINQGLDQAASEGFALVAFWAQPNGFFQRATLVGVLARPRGTAQPAPHCRVETVSSAGFTELSRTLLGVSAGNEDWFAAWCPASAGSYGSRVVRLADRPGIPAYVLPAQRMEQELREWGTGAIVGAFDVRERGAPETVIFVTLDRGMRRERSAAVPMPKPTLPQGAAALPADGGEPGRVYLELAGLFAGRKVDVAGVRARLSAGVLAKVAAEVKDFGWPMTERDRLEGRRIVADATDLRLVDGWQQGDAALLRVEGTHDGERSLIEVRLRRESTSWKVDDWSSWRTIAH